MQINDVLLKPYLTEKTALIREQEKSVVTFLINPKASKTEVKNAFFALYKIIPEKINIVVRKPAQIKTGTRTPGYTKLMKIAYITLPAGINIAITKEEVEAAKEAEKEESTPKKSIKNFFKRNKKEKSEKTAEKATSKKK